MISKSYYEEIIRTGWWFWILFLFVGTIAFLTSILVIQSLFELPAWWNPAPTSLLLVLIVVFVAFTLVSLNFRRLSIKLDHESIKVGYGIMRKTIPLNEVVSCEPTTAKLRVYGGVGIRIGTDRSLALTTSSGNAVRIVRRDGLPFVFSTKNPRELSKIINEISKKHILRSSSPSLAP